MASNRYAPEGDIPWSTAPHAGHADGAPSGAEPLQDLAAGEHQDARQPVWYGPALPGDEPVAEWNPSSETLRPVRGRHRVVRQRGGTVARSRAVLGVGVMAAVGAGGMATAHEGGAPGVGDAADTVRSMPDRIGLGGVLGGGGEEFTPVITAAPLTSAGLVADADGGTDAEYAVAGGGTETAAAVMEEPAAGEALRNRILAQADSQSARAEAERRDAAVDQAIAGASDEAQTRAADERAAEEERQRKAEEERQRKAEEERLRKLRASFTSPVSNYRLSSTYGQAGVMWESGFHTGLDFAAPAGTPVKNVHTGTVQEAAWAGSYGYRVIVELEDGTEVSYSHLSSMSVAAGQEMVTGDSIGAVGSTGNSSGPHLHLEVRPGGGDTVDPLAWLRNNGVEV